MTAPKPKRKSSSSRPPTSASKSTSTSPNLAASLKLLPDPNPQTAADHKLALALQAQNKPQPRSRNAKPTSASNSASASASATASTSAPAPASAPASAAKPVSSSSGQPSGSASASASTSAGSGRDRKAQAKGKGVEGDKKSPPPVVEGSRKTSRSAASAARQKTAVVMSGTQVEEEEDEEEGADGDEDEGEEDEDEEEDSGITRCVCGKETEDLASGLMIECDTCKAWQHGPCVGLHAEKDCPDTYYCEMCRPDLHDSQGLLIRPKPARKAAAHARSPSVTQHPAPTQASPQPPPPKPEPLSTPTSSSRAKPRTSVDVPAVPAPAPAPVPTRAYSPPDPAPALAHAAEETKPALDHSQRKRSTMNSRDAAYDDAIALSILEAGSAAARERLQRGQSGEAEEGGQQGEGKRRASEEQVAEGEGGQEVGAKKRKLSAGAEEIEMMEVDREEGGRELSPELGNPVAGANGGSPPNPSKVKHPNQYTYRPKPVSGSAPARPPRSPTKKAQAPPPPLSTAAAGPAVSATADGSLPPLPVLPTPVPSSRNGAPARARGDGGASAARDLENGGWGVPEHLKHLRHLLPSATPGFLDVPCAAPDAPEGEDGTPPATGAGVGATRREPATRVRFPGKRMTLPEMRKRAKNVLDYMGRIQVELSDREKRGEQMARAGRRGRERDGEAEAGGDGGAEEAERLLEGAASTKAESLRMMDGLTKEILGFQQKYFGSLD